MVAIEFNNGVAFKINNIALIRNFHAYVSSGNVRIVNAYDTRNELMPYTPFQDISINGVTYNSVEELLEILTPILFLKNGGSGTGGAVNISNGNIITKTVSVAIDWTQSPEQQIINFVNGQQFTVTGSERILFKAFRLIGDLNTSNSSEIYYWEFKPGKGTYGDAGARDITSDDIEFISFITNYQNNVIELGEIGVTPIEVFVNESGPYVVTSSSLNIFKATRQGSEVNFIYVGASKNIGDGAEQTSSKDYIDVNSQPVNSPSAGVVGLRLENLAEDLSAAEQTAIKTKLNITEGGGGTPAPEINYNTVAELLADQANQVENKEYTVEDASGWTTVTHNGWATFMKKAASTGSESDYEEREQQDFDTSPETFTANENQYGNHPSFLSQNEAIIWLLQNIDNSGSNPDNGSGGGSNPTGDPADPATINVSGLNQESFNYSNS